MGRDAVEATITLADGALVPGGRIALDFRIVVREAIKIRGAHVRFRGFEESKAVYTTSNGKTTTTHTAVEKHDVAAAESTFIGTAPLGFFRSLIDGGATLLGGGEHEKLARGEHTARLEVALPDPLPESFAGKKARIAYEAEVHLDIPAGRDFRHLHPLDVVAAAAGDVVVRPEPLTLRYPEDTERGFFDRMFGPDVAMRVSVSTTRAHRGDEITGDLEIRFPDKPGRIDAVVCKVLRRETTRARGHKDRHVETIVTERQERRDDGTRNVFASFRVRLPTDMPPDASGQCFEVRHELAISLDVPWAKDPTIRIPIVVV